jgi:hypothetical protein
LIFTHGHAWRCLRYAEGSGCTKVHAALKVHASHKGAKP